MRNLRIKYKQSATLLFLTGYFFFLFLTIFHHHNYNFSAEKEIGTFQQQNNIVNHFSPDNLYNCKILDFSKIVYKYFFSLNSVSLNPEFSQTILSLRNSQLPIPFTLKSNTLRGPPTIS